MNNRLPRRGRFSLTYDSSHPESEFSIGGMNYRAVFLGGVSMEDFRTLPRIALNLGIDAFQLRGIPPRRVEVVIEGSDMTKIVYDFPELEEA